MAEIPNEKQSGGGGLIDQSENAARSAAVQQLCTSLAFVDLTATHNLLMRKIARHLKKNIQRFEAEDRCKPIILQHLRETLTSIIEEIKTVQTKEIVEYIFAPEDRNQASKRDRLNSCTVALDINELLNKIKKDGDAVDLPVDMPESTVHYCTDCEMELPVLEGETYRDVLVKHFTNDPHKPTLKPQEEDIVLPTVSRKMAAMMKAEPAGKEGDMLSETEGHKIKLTEALLRVEQGRHVDVETLIAIYTAMSAVLMSKVMVLDLSTASKVITPILVSIKDNVNQSSRDVARVNEDEEDGQDDPNAKAEPKRLKFYQPIASKFDDFLLKHKLISLTDERGGKPAYFCIPCEFYTLRFGYDTIFAHVLTDAHVQQLSKMLNADGHISHGFTGAAAPHEIHELNSLFLSREMLIGNAKSEGVTAESYQCKICKTALLGPEAMLAHLFDETHIGKLSGKFFFKMREDKNVKWGQKSTDWKKFNLLNGKSLSLNQSIVLENFVKPLAKTLSQCQCCTITLKGQRQVVFNHVRQKKHLRNAVPRRLTVAFGNFVRPLEFFSSLGHFYSCTLCEEFPQSVMLNFSEIFEHSESEAHVSTVARMLRIYSANFMEQDLTSLVRQGILQNDLPNCILCGIQFATLQDAIGHIFTDIDHHNNVAARDYDAYKPHIVHYLLKNAPVVVLNNEYHCLVCLLVMPTVSGLLAHLSLADHIQEKLQPEDVFRYYLLLKNNAKTCKENSIIVRDQTTVECQKCNCYLSSDENVRSHVVSVKHKG